MHVQGLSVTRTNFAVSRLKAVCTWSRCCEVSAQLCGFEVSQHTISPLKKSSHAGGCHTSSTATRPCQLWIVPLAIFIVKQSDSLCSHDLPSRKLTALQSRKLRAAEQNAFKSEPSAVRPCPISIIPLAIVKQSDSLCSKGLPSRKLSGAQNRKLRANSAGGQNFCESETRFRLLFRNLAPPSSSRAQ